MQSATRCFAAFYLALFLSLSSTLPFAYAASDTKVANRTIERVSSPSSGSRFRFPADTRKGARRTYAHVPHSSQTVQLRTHSIHPPYIDEDLQNRYVVPGERFGKDCILNPLAPLQVVGLWRGCVHRTWS